MAKASPPFLKSQGPVGEGRFSLVLSGSHSVSLETLCRHFEVSSQDLPAALRKLPAVLLSGLTLEKARNLSLQLGRSGVTVTILPEESCSHYPRLDFKLREPSPAAPAPGTSR